MVYVRKYMLKEGDDLRQDQMVLQMVILMDSIMKKYGLDLKLTPYQVMACSTQDGLMEFVQNADNLFNILRDNNGDLCGYFKSLATVVSSVRGGAAGGDSGRGAGEGGPRKEKSGVSGAGEGEEAGLTEEEILDNFIRSCAGYCVITYILGIGDRHLENLMVTTSGKLFHIDFGYILGQDPKPFPPPFKLVKEMVLFLSRIFFLDAICEQDKSEFPDFAPATSQFVRFWTSTPQENIVTNNFASLSSTLCHIVRRLDNPHKNPLRRGPLTLTQEFFLHLVYFSFHFPLALQVDGMREQGYQNFRSKCCEAFRILRRHSNLILVLLNLMTESGIKDFLSPDKAEFVILKVQERFRLDLSDEDAERYFISLINDSLTALFPKITEQVHAWALRFR